jgi:hypothetical protein
MPVAEFPVCAPSDRRHGAATAACAILGAVARRPESPASELNGVGRQTGSRPDDAGVNPPGPTRAPMMNPIVGFIYGVALLGDSAAR